MKRMRERERESQMVSTRTRTTATAMGTFFVVKLLNELNTEGAENVTTLQQRAIPL
jgi:hypothetical protein